MGKKSNISWTDATWNPWRGCRKVSTGCKHCYMFRQQKQYGRDPHTVVRSKTTFRDPLKWREPQKVFVCSWSDFFIEEADDGWRAEAWDVMRQAPQHTYILLTKRPERIIECLPGDWSTGWPNVWLGVSVEDQTVADERIPVLLGVPAAVRWLSCEPLLGPINLGLLGAVPGSCPYSLVSERIHWVVAGGESGPGHRPMDMAWARSLRDQCEEGGMPFFFKQDADFRNEQRPWIVEEDGSKTEWRQLPGEKTT